MRLHLEEWGDPAGPPLVCLHGVAAHGGRFRRLAERLPGFRVLAPDLRGHGRSGYEPPWSVATHVEDVLETVDAAGVGAAAWLGHSFGGRLAIELAVHDPRRVERVLLLDPAIRIRPDNALRLAEEARRDRSFETVAGASPPLIGGALLRTPPELVEEDRHEHLVRGADGRYRYSYCPSAVIVAFSELVSGHAPVGGLRVPTLLVLGAESTVVGPRQVEYARTALGDLLEVETVPGGHVVLWDALAETADAVAGFLGAA